jgi:hypothetical protein
VRYRNAKVDITHLQAEHDKRVGFPGRCSDGQTRQFHPDATVLNGARPEEAVYRAYDGSGDYTISHASGERLFVPVGELE